MASIYPNRKDGKIVSFKFKALVCRDADGKQVFKCKTWTPQKQLSESKLMLLAQKQAVIWEEQIIKEYAERSPSEITLKRFISDVWYPSQMNEKEHRESTIAFYDYIVGFIINYFDETRLDNIYPRDIEKYLYYLKNTYRTANNKSLSQKTIRHHYATLNLIFEYAEKLDYIKQNPLSKVETPKLVKHKVDAFTKDEAREFITEIEKLPQKQRLMYMLLITTGIRRGECFGLQWADIDFENRLLRIQRNVTYTSAKGICIGLPKTSTGIRIIPLTERVINLLAEYKKAEFALCSACGNAYLFHSQNSFYYPQEPTYITKHMKRLMTRLNLPDMSPHDLRHTCASILLQSGADIKSVQDILGHADASTTLNFYVRSNIETMRSATQKAFNF